MGILAGRDRHGENVANAELVCWVFFKKRPTALAQFGRPSGNSLRASACGSSIQSSLSATPNSPSCTKVKAWEQRSHNGKQLIGILFTSWLRRAQRDDFAGQRRPL